MAVYNYVLSYNASAISPTSDQLQIFIAKNRDIDSWYLAFQGTFIIKSAKSLSELNTQFVQFFQPSQFLLTWIYPDYATGWLPPAVWEWISQRPYAGLFDKSGT